MKISELVLHNFRRYEEAFFQFHPHFNVLIGKTGKGKTTVLDALAILLNTYFQGGKMSFPLFFAFQRPPVMQPHPRSVAP